VIYADFWVIFLAQDLHGNLIQNLATEDTEFKENN